MDLKKLIEVMDSDVASVIQAVIFFSHVLASVITVEYVYFTNAENVRLLFVLLLAILGALIGYVVGTIAVMIIASSIIATHYILKFGIPVVMLVGIIYFLYSVIVWTN